MSSAEEKAALVAGVVLASATPDVMGMTGLLDRRAASASNQALTLPVAVGKNQGKPLIAGKWLNVFADSVNVQLAFGTKGYSPTLVYNQLVTIGTGSVAAGGTVPAGIVTGIPIPPDCTSISYICSGTTGFVELYVSEALASAL